MTCIDFLLQITNNGTKAILPRGIVNQHTITTGNDGNTSNGITVVCFKPEKVAEQKNNNKLIELISNLVINTPLDHCAVFRFYKHCLNTEAIPAEFRNGEYEPDKEKWTEFVKDMTLTISSLLYSTMFRERQTRAADTLFRILQTRIDAWNAKAIKIDDDEKKVTLVSFERF